VRPKAITEQMIRDAEVVITLGRKAHVEPVDGTRVENWDTDEPSERGIDGIERLVRDDITHRVDTLRVQLLNTYDQPPQASLTPYSDSSPMPFTAAIHTSVHCPTSFAGPRRSGVRVDMEASGVTGGVGELGLGGRWQRHGSASSTRSSRLSN